MKNYLLALLVLLLCMPTALASASSFTITANYGFEGKGRFDTAIPLTVTITNEGDAFSGELVTTFPEGYQLLTGQVYPLEMQAGETKELQLYIESYPRDYYYNKRGQYFYIFEGDVETGKEVKNVTITNSTPTLYETDTNIIGVFGNEMTASSLQKIRSLEKVMPVEILQFQANAEQFPTDTRALATMTTIVLAMPMTSLAQEQQQALYEWVQKGGQLVTDSAVEGTRFEKDYALLLQSGQQVITSEQLQKFAQGGSFHADITASNVTVGNAATAFDIEGNILGARQQIMRGALIQTAFSLSAAPFIEMDGYANVLDKFINVQIPHYFSGTTNDEIANYLARVNELFPSFAFSTWKIISVLALYILLIGPILYFILKRKDKREHAWWIIPVISVIFSIAFFLVGARERFISPQLQEMAVLKVTDSGTEQYFAQSVLANKSGDYVFHLPHGVTAAAYKMGATQLTDPAKAQWGYVQTTENGTQLTLKNVNYWGVQTIVGHGVADEGKFVLDLKNDNGHLTGTITNEFGKAVEDVQLWTGTTHLPLGSIDAGATLPIDTTIPSTILLSVAPLDRNTDSAVQTTDLEQQRYESLLSLAQSITYSEQLPVITAKVDSVQFGGVLQKKASITSTALIVQPVTIPTVFTKSVILKEDAFSVQLATDMNGGYKEDFQSQQKEWYLENGQYDLTYQLPKVARSIPMNWNKLMISVEDEQMKLQILNQTTAKYEEIEDDFMSGDPRHYLTVDGKIELQLQFLTETYGEVSKMPKLTLEGEKRND